MSLPNVDEMGTGDEEEAVPWCSISERTENSTIICQEETPEEMIETFTEVHGRVKEAAYECT